MLKSIHSPADVKKIPAAELSKLTNEIREELIRVVSENGGHLAANLGVVELTVALHRVFDCPRDSIIFDVGHQAYVHKLLTGRGDRFDTLRQYGGLSGFPKISESEYDAFGCGHSSTSVSAAIGIAAAKRLSGDDSYTVAVIGDGAFTGGMAYEALNNCAGNRKLIIILNDNTMSIARNVGAMDNYLNRYRNSAKYFRLKNRVKSVFQKIPLVGKGLVKLTTHIKNGVKHLLVRENFFEHMGLSYYGPLDGNDESLLETVLKEAKEDGQCSVVHIITQKGKGYSFAEARPDLFHGIGRFDPATGEPYSAGGDNFSAAFGDAMCALAEKDEKLCAISAAMPDGTGLSAFAEQFPERFFDVGIAEEHAVTFACGLARQGMKPVFAVYSTFAQRSYDQLIHDAALQNLPMVLALDRAGLVGEDGPTHHGIFDVSFLNQIPGFTVYSPENYKELSVCLEEALSLPSPSAVRYPRGKECLADEKPALEDGTLAVYDYGASPKVVFFTYGRLSARVREAASLLAEKGIPARVVRLIRIKPLAVARLAELASGAELLYFAEEGIRRGGVGEFLVSAMAEAGLCRQARMIIRAISEQFPTHGTTEQLFVDLGLTARQMAEEAEGQVTGDAH
ncbi:MAG: 1-deoxy-D-xylulose-5-phosphate synthase [Clostridia bacterium]|nr:1-deoxy-D-xylulose-5-phosphate synthase [Clostridia bacterium]